MSEHKTKPTTKKSEKETNLVQKKSAKTAEKEVVKHPEGNFLQSKEWGEAAKRCGHKPIFEEIDGEKILMIVKDAKRGRYLEIPGGPLIDWKNSEKVEQTFAKIKEIAKENKCVFVRFRPQLFNTEENQKIIEETGAKPAPFHLHAQNTIILNLEQSEDDLLANMRRKTRYEVRRAEKIGITLETKRTKEIYGEFHKVQLETAKRQGFIPPKTEELEAYREVFGDNATIYIAKTTKDLSLDGKRILETEADRNDEKEKLKDEKYREKINPIVLEKYEEYGAIEKDQTICYGLFLNDAIEADYFEAASTELGHVIPGAYGMIWQAMQDYKKRGMKRLNLWGIAPPNQPHHRYAKVTTFKSGFGGDVIEFIHAQDIVIDHVKYLKTELVENFRKKVRHLS